MTAAGLAVAIPAVLAFNVFGKRVAASEAELEGFAHDLREMIGRGDGAATLSAVAVTRGGAAGLASGPVPGRLA
jgi:biopolymer transport protein ExbB